MRLKGYSSEKLTLLIESLERKVRELGIGIEDTPIADDKENKFIEDSIQTVTVIKNKGAITLEHDVRVLCAIDQMRGRHRVYLFEKCKFLFVTRDFILSKAATSISNKNNNSYPLAVDIMGLTSNLWLRDLGNEKISTNILRQSIMGHIREQAISQELWEKFILKLEETEKSGSISQEDIAIIVSAKDTARLLAEEQEAAVDKIIKPEYIRKVKARANERDNRLADTEKKLAKVSNRARLISNVAAKVILVLLGIIITATMCLLTYILLEWIGLGVAADISAVVVFLVGALLFILFGKSPSDIIATTRRKVISATSDITYRVVCKIFNIDKEAP
jgi:hypothetical protein